VRTGAPVTISEDQLSNWTKPAFDNEDERRRNTESMISEAIRSHPLLKTLPLKVYAKGSYKNNTNVRRDSDVDVAVEYTGIIYPTYADASEQERIDQAVGLGPYTGPFRDAQGNTTIGEFKDAVGDALVGAFGSEAVTRHNKVFTVHESSRSLAADVVPCGTHRHYYNARSWAEGIRLLPDKPRWPPIDNYPQQHYDNGVAKNNRTSKRFKAVVRILKNLENRMVADGTSPEVASYLIECLVYNAPDSCFGGYSWAQRVRAVLVHIWEDTEDVACEKRWVEANDVKFLFHSTQKWSRGEARDFVHAAWQYVSDS
jgi:hypothetical protein